MNVIFKRVLCLCLCLCLCLGMFSALTPAPRAADDKIRIACIGDSITYGHDPATNGATQIKNNWPTVLGQILGEEYDVRNFGQNGITLSKSGGTPVWSIAKFTQSKTFLPDYVIIMLGTNDSPGSDSAEKQASLKQDLRDLVAEYRALESKPEVYIATSATAFNDGGFGLPPANIHNYIVPLQKEIAAELGCTLIDVHALTADMGANFPDNIHPNEAGHAAIGEYIATFFAKPDASDGKPIYEDTSYSFAERAADLVARMSMQQKASQLVERAAAIPASQLGGGALNTKATKDLSHYSWWAEALHGLLRDNENPQSEGTKDNVSYAQSLTMGSTWNPALYYEGATLISDEIRERSRKNDLGNCINLNFYSPTVNMQRDPRWGRNEESYSEDPFLTATMGTQFVLGMEGKDQDGNPLDPNGYLKTLTTIKHYTANNTEAIRTSGGADNVDLRALREYYVAPYRDVIQASDVRSVMTAYSYVNKEPCSYSSYLMDTLLRETFGFTGHITSDCDSAKTISNLNYTNPRTGKKLTAVEQMAGALAHGEDLECNSGISASVGDYNQLASQMIGQAVQTDKGTFTENTLDISVHRLMTARISTGELDENNPYTIAANERMADQAARGINNYTPERIAVVDKEVEEGVVMLKNDGILPLQIPKTGEYKVVIIGEHQTNSYLGLYSSEQRHAVDDKWRIWIGPGIEQAIKDINPNATVTRINSNTISNEDAIKAANAVIVVTGTTNSYSAEGRDRNTIALPNNQATLISNVGKLNPNTIAIMETCGPMQVTTFENDVKAILWSSYGGIRKGIGFAHVITGQVNPSGHLTATWFQKDADMPGIRDYNLYATGGSHGRTYMYYDGTVPVSYPFGYGLSYTTFAYSNLKIDKTAYDANDTVKVSFDVKNTGSVAGKEVAQLYIAQPDAPAELLRPIRRLEGFEKIELQPGETKTVSLEVKIPDLAFYNEQKDQFEVDTGKYQVQVGEDSAHADLKADFTVSGAMEEYPVVLTAKPNQTGDDALGVEQRLIFDKGVTVDPQLTVAMNNEKLYGYIIKEQTSIIKSLASTPLPEGMTFTYTSNRPEVAKVENGVIKTVGPGVATITVTGTLNGHTVTTDFVVYVMSNVKLSGITVDGEPLAKFNPDKLTYNMTLESKGHIPVVAATATNPDLKVVVRQAKSLPGSATIIVTDPDSGVRAVYEINFKVKAVASASTEIDFSLLADAGKYEIIGQNQSEIGEDGLPLIATRNSIEPVKGQNTGEQATTPEDLVKVPVSGDWTASLEVEFDSTGASNGYYQMFGFFAGSGDAYENLAGIRGGDQSMQNFLRENGTVTHEDEDGVNSAPGFDTSGKTYFLRIEKAGTTYTCYRSEDGEDWEEMFAYEETGNEAEYLMIDAYTGMTAGYKYTLKKLTIEGVGNGLPNIDFTTIADADKYEIVGQSQSEVDEGEGVALIATRNSIEPVKGQNTGEQATTPEDLIKVPVAGDWTASLELVFDSTGASNGYYQMFGFFAGSGDEYENLAGIRGGDKAMQNFLREDGTVTHEDEDGVNSAPGFDTSGKTYFLRIEKVGTTYTCYRSEDGEDWEEMFAYEDTGIEAEYIMIDAYTGMTAGYKYTLKSLTFEGGSAVNPETEDPAIETILADGDEIGFVPETLVYNIEVAKDSTKTPVVTAVPANKDTKVEITQLSGPFGTAVVTATAGSKTLTYTVSFNHSPEDDYFADGDYDKTLWTVADGGEGVEQGKGIVPKDGKTTFLTPAMGNWSVVVKAYCPENLFDAAVLVWQDADNYIKLNTTNPGRAVDGVFTPLAGFETPAPGDKDDIVYLKLDRKENMYTLSCSFDGLSYIPFGTLEDAALANPQLALMGEGVCFEYLCVTSAGGIEQYNMPDMLAWAAQNAADYMAASLPEKTAENLTVKAPHGCAVEFISDNEAVIAKDGTVTPAAKDTKVKVSVKADEAGASATSVPVEILVPGKGEAPVLDKAPLEKAIEEAEKLDADKYTEETAKALAEAIAAAKKALEEAKTQAELDAAKRALDDAIKALVEKPDVPTPTPTPHDCPGKNFTDMPAVDYWSHAPIDWAIVNKITVGTSETTFGPTEGCTRAQVVTFLWRAAKEPAPTSKENPFKDVKESDYFYNAVLWAVEKGITVGTDPDKFSPGETCTRAQIVTFLYRYEGKPEVKPDDSFTDVKADDYFADSVAWAVANGITKGTDPGKFSPSDTCTREQVVTFLYRDIAE